MAAAAGGEWMAKRGRAHGTVCGMTSATRTSAPISIVRDPADALAAAPPVDSAIGELLRALAVHGIDVMAQDRPGACPDGGPRIVVAASDSPVAREALAGAGI